MPGIMFCTRSRHAVFPIHRINLRWARTNSRSLRLTYAPFPTLLDRGQSLNTIKDRIRPSRPCRSFVAQFTITAVQFTFIPGWSRFSDRLKSGTDRSPVEWGYYIQYLGQKRHATLFCQLFIVSFEDKCPTTLGSNHTFCALITTNKPCK